MKTGKRVWALTLCVLMVVGMLAGCGGDDSYDYDRFSPKPTLDIQDIPIASEQPLAPIMQDTQDAQQRPATGMSTLDLDRFYEPDEDYIRQLLTSEWWKRVGESRKYAAVCFAEDGKAEIGTRALIQDMKWSVSGLTLKIDTCIGGNTVVGTDFYDICENNGIVFLVDQEENTAFVRESDWEAVTGGQVDIPGPDHDHDTDEPEEDDTLGVVCKTCGDKGVCPNCGGNKWCKDCDGNGGCPFCLRDGTEGRCRNCNGKTKVLCSWCDGDWECDNCNASGDCHWCDGSGECYKCDGTLKIACTRCDASGDCFMCDGNGTKGGRKCNTCKGTGDCNKCDGSKKMECFYCDARPGKCLQCLGDGECNECHGDGSVCNQCGSGHGYVICSYCDDHPGKCTYCKGEYICKTCGGKGELCKECTDGKCPDCGGQNTTGPSQPGSSQKPGNAGSNTGSGTGGGNCPMCGGYGTCTSCYGSGMCPNYNCIFGEVLCSKCDGGGNCYICGGLGEDFLTGRKCTASYCDDGECSACDGNGEVKCSTCGGDGKCTAKYCDNGWCTYCGGDGDY